MHTVVVKVKNPKNHFQTERAWLVEFRLGLAKTY